MQISSVRRQGSVGPRWRVSPATPDVYRMPGRGAHTTAGQVLASTTAGPATAHAVPCTITACTRLGHVGGCEGRLVPAQAHGGKKSPHPGVVSSSFVFPGPVSCPRVAKVFEPLRVRAAGRHHVAT